MIMVQTGDGLIEYHAGTRSVFANTLPRMAETFNAATQQQGGISRSVFETLNLVHVPIAHFSIVGLLFALGWGVHAKMFELVGLAAFSLVALLANSFICGALSGPHNRYQSRSIWVATAALGITLVCWRKFRMRNPRISQSQI